MRHHTNPLPHSVYIYNASSPGFLGLSIDRLVFHSPYLCSFNDKMNYDGTATRMGNLAIRRLPDVLSSPY